MNKHLRIHCGKKSLEHSGTATFNCSVLDRNGMEPLRSRYPTKWFQNGQNSSTCAL